MRRIAVFGVVAAVAVATLTGCTTGPNQEAVKAAHIGGGVPCLGITAPARDEQGFAELVTFFEMACAISGYMSGVNPFDQPGVEAYKKNMFRLLGKPGAQS